MVDQAGHSATAMAAASSALSAQHAAANDADRALVEALSGAHAATVEGLRRLDAIEADIESALARQDTMALDTPAGAHHFHRFLLAKHREIIDVVAQTAADGEAKAAVLQGLLDRYPATPASSTA
jgi:predicted RNA methylase